MIGLYERVSSQGQELAGQHMELEAYAARQAGKVKWYTDKFSGKSMDRPGMNALMDDIRSGRVTTLVVYRLDRLGRTAAGLTKLIEELQAYGCNFVSLREGIDLSTPAGRLIAHVLASVAAYETEVRQERQMAGIQAKRDANDGRCPWGGRPAGTFIKRTPELDQSVRDMKAQGKPVAAIARVCGISRPTVYAILKDNP